MIFREGQLIEVESSLREGDLLAEVAQQDPDRIALSNGNQSFTFAELDLLVQRMGHTLLGLWNRSGCPRFLPLVVDYDLESSVAALACIRYHIPFAPLEASLPSQRLSLILERMGRPTEIWSPHPHGVDWVESLRSLPGEGLMPFNLEPGYSATHGSDDGVVIFTSGSTGEPKGVVMSWKTFHERWKLRVAISEVPSVPPKTSLFVPLNWILGLTRLARIFAGFGVLRLDPRKYTLRELLFEVDKHHVTHLTLPNQLARLIAQSRIVSEIKLPHVRELSLGGESVRYEVLHVLRPVFAQDTVFSHSLGYSEAPLSVLLKSPIGKLPRTGQVHVGALHNRANTRLVPLPDTPGHSEVWCSGSIATEYLGQPDCTADRFITDSEGTRWWKSGDIVRRDASGQYLHVGRLDDVVKVSGKLASPSEAEAALSQIVGVKVAVVLPTLVKASTRLVGHIEVDSGVSLSEVELKKTLAHWLEPHLVPHKIHFHDALPITPRGKVDRQKLMEMRAD